MTELDVMKQDSEKVLAYWKRRAKDEEGKMGDIRILLTTLEWFLWMIERKEGA